MKLIADWGVHSPRLDRPLAAGCSHCRGPVGRLVRHEAGAGGTQVWWSCASWFRRANTPRCARLLRFERDLIKVLTGARRCRLCHFSIEDAIDPALSAIWCDRAPN
jgi:hypothetical protein